MKGRILLERDGAAVRITIDNPAKFNAMSMRMWRDLELAIGRALAEPDLRVIIIRGAGGQAFASGADISEFPKLRHSASIAQEYDAAARRSIAALRNAAIPVIAMIEGHCIGGGVLIALGCDLRYATDDSIYSIPAARIGLAYDWPATKDLLDAIGAPATKEMLYTSRRYSAREAETLGLINRALPREELFAHVEDVAARIAANAPLTIKAAKGVISELIKPSAAADLGQCDELCATCSNSEDYREGYLSFIDKRKPVFRGQ